MKNISTLVFAAALALAGATAVQAFTFESAAPGDSGGARNYVDPQDQLEPKPGSPQRFGSGSSDSDSRQGGFSMQFGGFGQPQSFDQKYNSDRYFNPNMQR